MDEVLNLWDGIFAKDPSLNICIFIGLALLLRIRDEREYFDELSTAVGYPATLEKSFYVANSLTLI
jgi:hypothetical protein